MGIEKRNEYEMFLLVPINSQTASDQVLMDNISRYNNPEIAVRLNNSSKLHNFDINSLTDLSLKNLEDVLSVKEK